MPNYTLRLSQDERKKLEAAAAKCHQSMAQYMRERLFDSTKIDDFEAYKAEQQEAFERVCKLLLNLIFYTRLGLNISSGCLHALEPEGAKEKIRHWQEAITKEMQKDE